MGKGKLYGAPRIVERRYRTLVAVFLVVGLCVGIGYSAMTPPRPAATTAILLQAQPSTDTTAAHTETQVAILTSSAVLASAAASVSPPIAIDQLEHLVSASAVGTNILRVEVRATSSARAVELVNAVTNQYLRYVNAFKTVGGSTSFVLESASVIRGHPARLIATDALLGLAAGVTIGFLALWRKRRVWRNVQLIQAGQT